MNYYLAIDFGASSGRHILAHIENGKIIEEEIYRFENGMKKKDGHLYWDIETLFNEIINGLKVCKEINKIPVSMAIDTWAVDYVLLDKNGNRIRDVYGYRDNRTEKMDDEVYKLIPEKELYATTGIQKQIFNTIYQLMADARLEPELFEKAKTFLMIPDYFNYRLTGIQQSEYTNATSTQLVDPELKNWNRALIKQLGLKPEMFLPLKKPGTPVGDFLPEIVEKVGFNTKVIQCASHDTASAIMAMPCLEDGLYISSGTWSLMGVELKKALMDANSAKGNFTNEGGYEYRFRYLKNIMGLWMIQSVRHELNDEYSFGELCDFATEATISSQVDVNDDAFFAPDSMIEAIKEYCRNTKQEIPETVGEIASVVYNSLAMCYEKTVREIEANVNRKYSCIYVIGGGSKAGYLNQLTANYTKKTVYAGPAEATALGNILAQMIHNEEYKNLMEARKAVLNSYKIQIYKPE
ncbi:MAG: rhamnulokinase [Holdemanella sp.]|nr:rhamnulokinase [Holdemanella sp.]